MHERSHAGIFSSIFIDIGDEQSIEDDLSTYSSHLTNMKIMMKSCNPDYSSRCTNAVMPNLHLEYYDDDVLSGIIRRSASILDVPCSTRAASEIASRSRGTPRIANALLRRVRDFAQVKGSGSIDTEIANFALEALNIDKYGLDEIDNKILCTIIDKFKCRIQCYRKPF